MDKRKLKFGVVGLGGRGKGLLKTLLACDDANVIAICDKYEDRVEEGAKLIFDKYGVEPTKYSDYGKMLEDKEIEAVLIATSWEQHIAMAIKSMYAKKLTAMEVGGAYDLEECWNLVKAYEETKTPFMMLENCCFDKFELLVTSLHRAGKLGEIVHCHGGYRHDIRDEVLGGVENRHYRLDNYLRRNCENYPTHELGPIAKLLDVNRGNKLVSLVSMSSKAVGLHEFANSSKNPFKGFENTTFKQGDIVNTLISCADGSAISIILDTTLLRYYSREFTVNSTKGVCSQEFNAVMLENEADFSDWEPNKTVEKHLNNAEKYNEYLPEIWQNISEEEKTLGHGGMDYFTLKAFIKACLNGEEMPIDVYDAATWMCITALSEASIAMGGAPQMIPDFTNGKWVTRKRKDVVEFPTVNK